MRGRQYPALDPVDTLVHLATHTALSGGDRLGWFMDVDQTLRTRSPDWDGLVDRANEWGLALLVHLVLARARRSIGAPVPTDVLEALSPGRAWSGLTAVVDSRDPVHRSTGRRSPGRLLARSAHPSLASTLRSVVAAGGSTVLGSGPDVFAGDHVDNPLSVYSPSGDAHSRERFFTRLVSTDRSDGLD